MKLKMTSYTLSTLLPLTEAQETNLRALAARPESEIDYSDIPPLTEEQFKQARRRCVLPVHEALNFTVSKDEREIYYRAALP